jgi:hypothetical protein
LIRPVSLISVVGLDLASVDYTSGNTASVFLDQLGLTATLTGANVAGSGTHNVVATYALRRLQCGRTPHGVLPIERKEGACLDSYSTRPLPAMPMSIGYCGRNRRFSSRLLPF